ncbi:hypothetical protein SM124_14720 [Bacillus sp. 31A1R]|uniref:DUF3221 domain-containing protein n=1 Tax=Robertmurraya mangrovi TaxID=3098077 RepID=A0ABU5J0M3_9BACI|nr:hypothetical protein [Bacillus sp. 31A1R]MDZ5472968.1 hypothetical protein [Bacillus sp. 31A1R]
MPRIILSLIFLLFTVLFISACAGDYGRHYVDDEMIGTVWEVKKGEKIVVDISEWETRNSKGNKKDIAYPYAANIKEETVINHEDGTKASIEDIKKGQKVLVNPPRGNDFEGYPEEIVLLEMTYEEKYARLLSHIDGLNLVVMYEDEEKLPSELQEPIYENITNILKNKDQRAVAAWMEYDEDYVVDFKEELGIERFPVMLVFNKEELVFKTYYVDDLYNFFNTFR